MPKRIAIRFFDDQEVRAVWDDEHSKWWFSAVDIVGVLSQSADSKNYWYVLKNRLKKAGSEVLTNCKGFRQRFFTKEYLLDENGCFCGLTNWVFSGV